MSTLNIGGIFVNLPPTGKQVTLGGITLSNKRAPTDLFGAVELSFTGLVDGTDVVILKAGTQQVLEAVDQNAGDTFVYQYFTPQSIDVGFIKAGYVTMYLYNYPLSAANVELPIQQRADRNYQ